MAIKPISAVNGTVETRFNEYMSIIYTLILPCFLLPYATLLAFLTILDRNLNEQGMECLSRGVSWVILRLLTKLTALLSANWKTTTNHLHLDDEYQ